MRLAYYPWMIQTPPTSTTFTLRPLAAQPSRDPQETISQLIAGNPALEEMITVTNGQRFIAAQPFVESISRYGFSMLNESALGAVAKVTEAHQGRVVSVFTGRGYAEAQMVAAGLEVIGFDREVPSKRWLLDTHQGPHGISWKRFADRALFMSFPDVTKEGTSVPRGIVDRYLAAGGSTVILIAEAHPTEHAIKCDRALIERLQEGECVARIELPKWPVIEAFIGYGHVHHSFEPVLTAYRFTR